MCDSTYEVLPTREAHKALMSKVFIEGQARKHAVPTWFTSVILTLAPQKLNWHMVQSLKHIETLLFSGRAFQGLRDGSPEARGRPALALEYVAFEHPNLLS